MSAYDRLEQHCKRIAHLEGALGILYWDKETMMPPGAAPARAEVEAELSLMQHELQTSTELADLLAEAQAGADELDDWQRANLREIRHRYLHANAVPGDLVQALVRARSESLMCWRDARPENDFASFAPKLQRVLELRREEAAVKSEALGVSRYESLMDEYDPGRREAQVDSIFDELVTFLPPTIDAIRETQASQPSPLPPPGPFPLAAQEKLSRKVMEILDFPFERGRLDTTAHPFSGGAPGDIRITTRYSEADFTHNLMAVIHETGHALYEDGLPERWRGQPVGENRGMTLHESQSLLLEMQAARSGEFLRYLIPVVREALGGEGEGWDTENLLRVYRKVEPGLIRVEADEVTYPLHVVLRYRLEKAMLAGELDAAELPTAWNEGMAQLLGITPDSDRDGVLQDIHWADGTFGYFPTYSLGAMAAAQLFGAACEAQEEILPALGSGNFQPLYRWLGEHVRSLACFYTPDELIERATGSPLSTEAYKAAVTRRYLLTAK